MVVIPKVRRPIEWLIVHCASTKRSMNISKSDVERWHLSRGWNGIGYNFFVKFDGTIERGRNLHNYGAHTVGRSANKKSIGICIEGGMSEDGKPEDTLTPDQWRAIIEIFCSAKKHYPQIKLAAHNQFDKKPCPCFDIREYADKHGFGLVTLQDAPLCKLPK